MKRILALLNILILFFLCLTISMLNPGNIFGKCAGSIKCAYYDSGNCLFGNGYYTISGCGYSQNQCTATKGCDVKSCYISDSCKEKADTTPTPTPTPKPSSTSTPTPTPTPSDNPDPTCDLSLTPATITIIKGTSATLTATPSHVHNGSVSRVDFSSGTTTVATVDPSSDSSSPYSVVVTGLTEGTSVITARARMSGSNRCSDTSTVTVLPNGPWWQTKDADVTTNGDLGSSVPSGEYFGLPGSGGYSGVPSYAGSVNLTNLNVSGNGWLANSAYSSAKLYNSVYFNNSVPSEVTVNEVPSNSVDGSLFESGGTLSFGYYWYIYDAASTGLDLNITSAMDLGGRKVILIVKGANLNFNGNINLTDGEGFFLGVSSGNTVVAPTVSNLEGIYVTDGVFSTGTTGASNDSQLWVRGTVAGFGGISLQRDLGTGGSPAELFEYAPDQDILFPAKLGMRPGSWREVAP